MNTTTKTSAHANCSHAATKSARSTCRKMRAAAAKSIEYIKTEIDAEHAALIASAPERARKSMQNVSDADVAEYKRLIASIES